MRHNSSQTRSRRSHHALKEPALSKCSHCNEYRRPHHMCLNCGYYNGRQVMDLEGDRAKREERIKTKHERIRLESGVADTPADVRKEAVADEMVKDTVGRGEKETAKKKETDSEDAKRK